MKVSRTLKGIGAFVVMILACDLVYCRLMDYADKTRLRHEQEMIDVIEESVRYGFEQGEINRDIRKPQQTDPLDELFYYIQLEKSKLKMEVEPEEKEKRYRIHRVPTVVDPVWEVG